MINYNCRRDESDTKQLRYSEGLISESLRHNYSSFKESFEPQNQYKCKDRNYWKYILFFKSYAVSGYYQAIVWDLNCIITSELHEAILYFSILFFKGRSRGWKWKRIAWLTETWWNFKNVCFSGLLWDSSLISNCMIASALQEAIPFLYFFSFQSKVSHLVRKVKLRTISWFT